MIWVASTYMASISVAEEVRDGGEIGRVRDRDRESGRGRWGKKGYGEGRELLGRGKVKRWRYCEIL